MEYYSAVKKELTFDTNNNKGESQIHYAERKKSAHKGTSWVIPFTSNPRRSAGQKDHWLPAVPSREEQEGIAKRQQKTLRK